MKHDLKAYFPDEALIFEHTHWRLFEQVLIMFPQIVLMFLVDKVIDDLFTL